MALLTASFGTRTWAPLGRVTGHPSSWTDVIWALRPSFVRTRPKESASWKPRLVSTFSLMTLAILGSSVTVFQLNASLRKAATNCCWRSILSRSARSEEHTSELQSRQYLVCRLLLEKKKKITINTKRNYINSRHSVFNATQ